MSVDFRIDANAFVVRTEHRRDSFSPGELIREAELCVAGSNGPGWQSCFVMRCGEHEYRVMQMAQLERIALRVTITPDLPDGSA